MNFCLNDGSFLTNTDDNQPKTVLMEQPRITNQTNWDQQNYQPPTVWNSPSNIQSQQSNSPARFQTQDQTLPTISMILGIIAVVIGCCYGGIPLGAGAIIVGIIAINNEKNEPSKYRGRGMAIAGIITGAVGFAISIIVIIGVILR